MQERKRAPRKELPLHVYHGLVTKSDKYDLLKDLHSSLCDSNKRLINEISALNVKNAAIQESKKSIELELSRKVNLVYALSVISTFSLAMLILSIVLP